MTTLTLPPLWAYTRVDQPERSDYLGKPSRRLTTDWVVKTGANRDGLFQAVVQVITTHDKGRKVLTSRFGWITKSEGTEKWSSDNRVVSVGTVPVARYSKKALVAAHEAAVALVVQQHEISNLADVTAQAIAKGGDW